MRGICFSYLYIMANNLGSYYRRKKLRQPVYKAGSTAFEENGIPYIPPTDTPTPTPTPTPTFTPSPTPTATPTFTPTPTPSPTPTDTPTPTPTNTPTSTPTFTPTATNTPTPSPTPTNTPTPSPTPTSSGPTFSHLFIGNAAPGTTIENAWTSFRAALTGTYTTMTLSSSLGSSITVTDVKVQDIANALRTATTGTNFSVVIGANTWRVIQGCVSGTADANSIYLTNDNACSCGGAGRYTVRPMIKNANWGGINGSSCSQSTQTITVTFS